jgi:3-dehydroquinate dehydratase / shikimate dehydrogenase
VITGVEMFVRQAMLQFWLFTRKEAPADLMREVLKGAIGPLKYMPPPPKEEEKDEEKEEDIDLPGADDKEQEDDNDLPDSKKDA